MEPDRQVGSGAKPEDRLPPSMAPFPAMVPPPSYHMNLDPRNAYHGSYEMHPGSFGDNSASPLYSISSPPNTMPSFLSSPHAHFLFPSTPMGGIQPDLYSYTADKPQHAHPSQPLTHLPFPPFVQDYAYHGQPYQIYQAVPIPLHTPRNDVSAPPIENQDLTPISPLPAVWSPKNVKRLHLRKGMIHPVSPEGASEPAPVTPRMRRSLPSSASSSPRPKGTSARTDPDFALPSLPGKMSPTSRDASYQARVDQPLWVNNLPLQWNDSEIELELQAVLDANCKSAEKIQILRVQRMNDAPAERYSRGLAVITLPTMKDAESAMQILRHCKIQGKFLSCSFQRPIETSESEDAAASSTNTLFVANVHPSVTESQIKLLFMQFGDVVKTNVARNRHSSQSRGFVFIEYAEHASCELALRFLQNESFCGQPLKLKLAKSLIADTTADVSSKSSTAPVSSSAESNMSQPRSQQTNLSPRTKRATKSSTDTVFVPSRSSQRERNRKAHVAVSSPRLSHSLASSLSPRSTSSLSASTDTASSSTFSATHQRRFSTSSLPHFSSPSQLHSDSLDSASVFASSEMFDSLDFEEPKNL